MPSPSRFFLAAALTLCTPLLSSALPADGIEDIEHVPTPTRLPELLPPGGIDAVDIGFWLIFATPDEDGAPSDSMYMYWSVEPRLGRLYIEHIYGSNRGGREGSGFHYRKRLIYSRRGEFLSYTADLQLGAGHRQSITGKLDADQIVLTTINRRGHTGFKQHVSERSIPVSTFNDAVPVEWMPLVIAYHIRHGSLGYDLTTLEFATGQMGQTRIEDLGTELYQHAAELHNAHFLGVDIRVAGQRTKRRETLKVLTAKDGNYFQIHYQEGSGTTVRRSSIDEVVEVFGVEMPAPAPVDWFTPLTRRRASH